MPVAVIGGETLADGSDVAEGTKADAAATNSTSSWSVISLLKGLYAKLAGTLVVSGQTADGVAPANPALHVAGVDGGGLKRSLLTDTAGTLFATPRHSSTDWTTTVSISGSTAASTVKAAAEAGVRNYITGFQATNNGTVACLAQIMDGAGAVLAFFWLPANATVAVSVVFPTPLRTPANSAVTVNVNQASAGLLANLQGYTA